MHAAPDPRPTAEITREGGRLRIVARGPRYPALNVMFGVFAAAWIAGAVAALRELFSPETATIARAFMAFWLTGWLGGGPFALHVLLWAAAGREIAEVSGRTLSLKRTVTGLGGWHRYELGRLTGLRADTALVADDERAPQPLPDLAVPGLRRGRVVFEHGGRTVRFGSGLRGADVERVLAALREAAPESRSQIR